MLTLGIIVPEVSFPASTEKAVIQEMITCGIVPGPAGYISRDCRKVRFPAGTGVY